MCTIQTGYQSINHLIKKKKRNYTHRLMEVEDDDRGLLKWSLPVPSPRSSRLPKSFKTQHKKYRVWVADETFLYRNFSSLQFLFQFTFSISERCKAHMFYVPFFSFIFIGNIGKKQDKNALLIN
jgi:hypothetical protein